MEKLLERNEVEQKDKWDLESVYKSNKELKIDFQVVQDNIVKLEATQEEFTISSKKFLAFLELYNATTRILKNYLLMLFVKMMKTWQIVHIKNYLVKS